MSPLPSHVDLTPVYRLADRAAADLCRTLRLPSHERDDLRQDLLCDLLGRLPAFDPERGTLSAFAQVCFKHHGSRLARQRRREAAAVVVSLDAPLPGRPQQTLGDTFAETDGLSAWLGQSTDSATVVERRIDLANALQSVDPIDVPLCAALVDQRPDEVAKTGQQSRATVYRRVREIRLRLLVAGVASWA